MFLTSLTSSFHITSHQIYYQNVQKYNTLYLEHHFFLLKIPVYQFWLLCSGGLLSMHFSLPPQRMNSISNLMRSLNYCQLLSKPKANAGHHHLRVIKPQLNFQLSGDSHFRLNYPIPSHIFGLYVAHETLSDFLS